MQSISMIRTLNLTLVLILFWAQSSIACGNKKCTPNEIHLEYNEYGQLKPNDCNTFKLLAGNEYTFYIKVDAPKQQHRAFLNALVKKLNNTYEKLDDPSYPYAALYSSIWGNSDFTEIKTETKALLDILKGNNPSSVTNAPEEYKYFLGETFLNDNLFKEVFEFKDNLNATVHPLQDYNTEASYNFKYTPKSDEDLNLRIYVADMEKNFYKAYFTKSRNEIATELDKIKTHDFYLNELKKLNTLLDELKPIHDDITWQNLLNANSNILLCPSNYRPLQQLTSSYNSNMLVNLIINTNWFQQWIWFNEGEIALNPLPFTNVDLVPKSLKSIPAELQKADDYNKLRKDAISILHQTNQLSPTRADTRVFDSLVIQSNQGNEKFLSTTYQKRIAENKKQATAYQQVFKTINRSSYNVLDVKKFKSTYTELYNVATQKVVRVNNKVTPTIATKWNMEVVGFNIQEGQHFEVKEKDVPIPAQSSAIAGLNQAGDALGIITSNLSKVGKVGINIAGNLSSKTKMPNSSINFIPNFPIAPSAGGNKLAAKNAKTNFDERIKDQRLIHTYNIYFNKTDDSLWVNVVYEFPDLSGLIVFNENLSNNLSKQITDSLHGTEDCIFDELNKKLISKYKGLEFHNIKGNKKVTDSIINLRLIEISGFISGLINEKILLLNARIGEFNHFIKTSNIAAIDSAYQNMSFILPPRKYLANIDTTPAYFNSFHPLVMADKANKKHLILSVYDTESNKILRSRTDAFKTAPSHWVLPSMGLGYVFNDYTLAEAKLTNGTFEKREEENQLRLMAGLHFYPAGVIMADDRFMFCMGKEMFRRISIYTGVSFPKPLENIHYGLGFDLWAGIKVVGGIHNYRYTAYKLQNGEIIKQTPKYVTNGCFVSLQIEPLTFVKLLGILN